MVSRVIPVDPFDLVIFGGTGDLARRKIIPGLFRRFVSGQLPADSRIIGAARSPMEPAEYKSLLEEAIEEFGGDEKSGADELAAFLDMIDYVAVDAVAGDGWDHLKSLMRDGVVRAFYFSVAPSLFGALADKLHEYAIATSESRIVVEKPFGHDLPTARALNAILAKHFDERQIYRIDHYLGKETVQNLLALRFANRFINSQWDQSCIDHIQITVAEVVGIEGRWSYYDKVGQLRDMVQNHLMQLLCLVAMEPPNSLEAESIRDEKVKIVKALRRIDATSVKDHVVRGQYSQGWSQGKSVVGYMEEEGCEGDSSNTETFVAIKAYVDNWRWSGVPFYLRTGKRMAEKVTEIIIQYKELPHDIFGGGGSLPNKLIIRLQPNEGIEMTMVSKRQSLKEKLALQTHTLNLDFREGNEDSRIPDAYERLFLDAINGDQSLFVGREEIEESWRWCDELMAACQAQGVNVKQYHAGSWGPAKAEILIETDRRSWHV